MKRPSTDVREPTSGRISHGLNGWDGGKGMKRIRGYSQLFDAIRSVDVWVDCEAFPRLDY